MKLWVVFIQGKFPDSHERWIDSMWAKSSEAISRVSEVRDSMRACGSMRFEVSYTQTTRVADCRIEEKRLHRKKPN